MKRTLGRPTYAFEARQYVVSVCDGRQWVPRQGVCVSVRVSRCAFGIKHEWMLRMCVWLVTAMYNTGSSLSDNCCLTHSGDCLSQLMRQNILTKEASVCDWLSIDHMVLTRVESGRMIREDDFIPHHMYQLWGLLWLAVSSSCFRASPTEHLQGVNSQSVTSTWGCVGSWVWGYYSSRSGINR